MLNLLIVLAVVAASTALAYAAARVGQSGPAARDVAPFLSGAEATEHAVSRYHVRWYTITMIFLAFDMEMAFMYPWSVVVADLGAMAVAEMFGFLAVLMIAVLYAWREGALRWV
ncbi:MULTISPECIES: NADH-quinone oxidoreductase subunit A [Nocardia]|jgi:NADH-quinone oxidoreductase subunit A|uniref:NADH-quinone oxidoreductase subunit n=1 Tax=Nocardia ignorata TaxID=145285 RepID=A0A4R6PJL9_NOCIG|nr:MULTISPECIES: NADH-quinone oxidoreductase subunit A [Nocardia]MBC7299751.1 NADH-quinone oxidoreductase subunit A [Nocardia sp.]TDP38614.1 NADH dehydrogenase subunit A [Nocardia ignorata]